MFRKKIDRQIDRISASIFGGKDVKKNDIYKKHIVIQIIIQKV